MKEKKKNWWIGDGVVVVKIAVYWQHPSLPLCSSGGEWVVSAIFSKLISTWFDLEAIFVFYFHYSFTSTFFICSFLFDVPIFLLCLRLLFFVLLCTSSRWDNQVLWILIFFLFLLDYDLVQYSIANFHRKYPFWRPPKFEKGCFEISCLWLFVCTSITKSF